MSESNDGWPEDEGRGPVRIAVVGIGYWGPNLVRNLHELPGAEVAWACDLRPEALAALARRYPGVPRTSRLEDVLDDPEVDAVVVATPVSTHHKLALAALTAGKHVLVEKPLAGSSKQACELLQTAADRDLVLMPGHTFLYSPSVTLIRDLIASRELGDVYFISTSRVNLGIHQPDVSVVWDLGPHDFSILRYWLDELPVSVSAISRSCVVPTVPDVAFIHLAFGSGTIAQVELAWLAPSKLRRTTIVGSQKMVIYDDTSNEPVRIFDAGADLRDPQTFGEYQLTYRTGDILSPKVAITEPLAAQLADFCMAIRNGTTPRSSGAVGLDVVRITEAVDRSLDCNGGPVPIDDSETLADALAPSAVVGHTVVSSTDAL
ncbi:MAG: Gfo/Idh/MocA family protein [Gaiellaceae bacterium]